MSKKTILRYLGSGFFISILIYKIDLLKVYEILQHINLWLYCLVFMIFLLNKLIVSYRWQILLRVQDISIKLSSLYNLYLFGFIFNFILPSSIGGDAYKLYKLFDSHPDKKSGSVSATLFDRFAGLSALIILTSATILFNDFFSSDLRILFIGLFIFIFFIAVPLFFKKSEYLIKITKKLPLGKKLQEKTINLVKALTIYKKKKHILFYALLLSLAFQSLSIFNQYLLFKALDVNIPLLFMFIAIPLTSIITTMPISIGGIGLREVSLIGILGAIGISDSQVLSYSLGAYSLLILLIFLYGTIFVSKKCVGFFINKNSFGVVDRPELP